MNYIPLPLFTDIPSLTPIAESWMANPIGIELDKNLTPALTGHPFLIKFSQILMERSVYVYKPMIERQRIVSHCYKAFPLFRFHSFSNVQGHNIYIKKNISLDLINFIRPLDKFKLVISPKNRMFQPKSTIVWLLK